MSMLFNTPVLSDSSYPNREMILYKIRALHLVPRSKKLVDLSGLLTVSPLFSGPEYFIYSQPKKYPPTEPPASTGSLYSTN